MDVKELFANQLKKQKEDNKPRTFVLQVDSAPQISARDDRVFRVLGTRSDTGERVAVVSVLANKGQTLPQVGEVMRADKAVKQGVSGSIQVYNAEYFHTYAKGFCINAVMQPMPVRKSGAMESAQVHAYDPKGESVVLTGSQVKSNLVDAIVAQLMPWRSKSQSAITHDVAGKPLWAEGSMSGVSPLAVVRFAKNSFKVFGMGGVALDKDNREAGYRLPSEAEIRSRVAENPAVKNVLNAIAGLVANGCTDQQLDDIDVAVLPGLALQVGRDAILFAQKKNREYFSVPDAYKVMKEGAESYYGHRESFIHLKQTRTNRFCVVDTSPAPGRLSPSLPMFAAETLQAQRRAGEATPTASAPQEKYQTKAEALANAEFGEPVAGATVTPARASAPMQTSPQAASSHADFDESEYDFDGLDDDMQAIESLNAGLDSSEVEDLFAQAEAISAARSTPRFG